MEFVTDVVKITFQQNCDQSDGKIGFSFVPFMRRDENAKLDLNWWKN